MNFFPPKLGEMPLIDGEIVLPLPQTWTGCQPIKIVFKPTLAGRFGNHMIAYDGLSPVTVAAPKL
jgi:hypothetical protein